MTDKDLVDRAVRNARGRTTGKHVRWSAVADRALLRKENGKSIQEIAEVRHEDSIQIHPI